MFNQYSHKSLHRAERSSVNHDRTMFLIVCTRVFQIKTLRKIVIDLYCAELPLSSECIFDHKVQFWSVKGSFANFTDGFQTSFGRSLNYCSLCFFPNGIVSYVLLCIGRVSQRNLCRKVVKLQGLENIQYYIYDFTEFVFELFRCTEDMSIVLSKRTHSCQAVQFPRLLITIYSTKLCQTNGQVFVRMRLRLIYLNVMRAVHRLQHIFFALKRSCYGTERILTILLIVSRGLI